MGRVHGRQGELEDASRGRACVGVGAAWMEEMGPTEELVMCGKGTIVLIGCVTRGEGVNKCGKCATSFMDDPKTEVCEDSGHCCTLGIVNEIS